MPHLSTHVHNVYLYIYIYITYIYISESTHIEYQPWNSWNKIMLRNYLNQNLWAHVAREAYHRCRLQEAVGMYLSTLAIFYATIPVFATSHWKIQVILKALSAWKILKPESSSGSRFMLKGLDECQMPGCLVTAGREHLSSNWSFWESK